MGIYGIKRVLDTYRGMHNNEKHLSRYAGWLFVIDAFAVIYRHCIGQRSNGNDIVDHNGKPVNELFACLKIVVTLIRFGITPLFVFDGDVPEIKRESANKRRMHKIDLKCKYNEIENKINSKLTTINNVSVDNGEGDGKCDCTDNTIDENACDSNTCGDVNPANDYTIMDIDLYNAEINKLEESRKNLFKRCFKVDPNNVRMTMFMLEQMGIPIVQAPFEADAQCAAIASCLGNQYVGVLTDDIDVLLYGAENMLMLGSLSGNHVEEYTQSNLIELFKNTLPNSSKNFTKRNFIEMCLLMGTDYFCGMKSSIEAVGKAYAEKKMKVTKNVLTSLGINDPYYLFAEAKLEYTNPIIYDVQQSNLVLKQPRIPYVVDILSRFLTIDSVNKVVDAINIIYKIHCEINADLAKINNDRYYEKLEFQSDKDPYRTFKSYRWKHTCGKYGYRQEFILLVPLSDEPTNHKNIITYESSLLSRIKHTDNEIR